jgi:hypothetical protein
LLLQYSNGFTETAKTLKLSVGAVLKINDAFAKLDKLHGAEVWQVTTEV